MPLIEVKNVIGGYGGAPILNGVNIAIEQSDIGVIVGPNGAGKSTTLKAIFGLLKVTGGSIVFEGEEITNALPDRLVRRGLSFVPQEKNVFVSMSVQENLEMISRARSTRSSTCSRCWPKSGGSRRANSRAASARWSPWAAR